MRSHRSYILALLLGGLAAACGAAAVTPPLLTAAADGSCVLANELVTLQIDKDGVITSLRHGGSPNLIESGYLVGPYIAGRSTAKARVVRNTADIAEIAYAFRASNLDVDLHYILMPGVSGVYCYLELFHDAKRAGSSDALGFFKHVIKADPNLFTFLQSTDTQQGFWPPASAVIKELNKDHTYLLDQHKFQNTYCPDYYSKYDYMHYAYEHGVYGLYAPARQTGLYIVNASAEWTPGGPTKSFQTVHDPAVINTIINDEHILQDGYQVNHYPAGQDWRKFAGPFLIYINQAPTAAAAWQDAKAKAAAEAKRWPYSFVNDPDYPMGRSTVHGRLELTGGSAAGAWCVLAAPGSDWQDQCLGYIYWTRADADGNFEFPAVRPGGYILTAYGGSADHPREDNPFNDYASPAFRIPPGRSQVDLGPLAWKAETHGTKVFQIGIPDRSTREFKLGNLRRQFMLWERTPGTLDYIVPPRTLPEAQLAQYEAQHWFYLESESGSKWRIHFACDEAPVAGGKAWLSLALAGTCKSPVLGVQVNGHRVWQSGSRSSVPAVTLGDDASVRRCVVNGAYHHYIEIPFDATLLHKGDGNILMLSVDIPGRNPDAGGVMYDALKLEVEAP